MNLKKQRNSIAAIYLMCGILLVSSVRAGSQEMKENICEAENGKNCPTIASSMLQTHTTRQRSDLHELADTKSAKYEDDAQQDATLRVEKHGAFDLRIYRDSPTDDGGRKAWILISKTKGDQALIKTLTGCKPEGARVKSAGHPDEGGTAYLVVEATDDEMKQELDNCKDSIDPNSIVVETDSVVKIPEGEDQKEDPALLEEAKVGPWGLDRIDQRDLPLDGSYSPPEEEGEGVDVYVADTGIYISHDDFGGRAKAAWEVTPSGQQNVCTPSDTDCAKDGHGHGTHCAGTIAGSQYGVAKKATVHAVKVLSDSGSGWTSEIIAGMDFVETKHRNDSKPVVLSMSLGGPSTSKTMEEAVNRAIASGIMVVVAAGNDKSDACNFSPAFVPGAITVGSTTSSDARSWFSNYGSCLDIYAPGSAIKSAIPCKSANSNCSASWSGTSMACPHVSGALAVLIALNPTEDPAFIEGLLKSESSSGKISDKKDQSPDRFLYVNSDATRAPAPSPPMVVPGPPGPPGPAGPPGPPGIVEINVNQKGEGK